VYYLPKGKRAPIPVADDLVKPNGIVGTPDGQTLYVADIMAGKTYKYHIKPDGGLSDKQLFVNQGSDGMTLDNQGNVYLTGKGVTVYNPRGEKILHIPITDKWTANVCFGGKDRSILFITASESVYTLKTLVKGVE
jgi:gluconolactonase